MTPASRRFDSTIRVYSSIEIMKKYLREYQQWVNFLSLSDPRVVSELAVMRPELQILTNMNELLRTQVRFGGQ